MKTKKKVVKKKAKLTAIEEKRVAVLKDAIAQVKIGAYIAQGGGNGYVVNDDLNDKIEGLCQVADIISDKGKETELQKYINKLISPKSPCDVCAKGALFLSSIRKYNNVSLGQVEEECQLNDMASDKMRDFFGHGNADLMEDYFENGNRNYGEQEGEDDDEDPWMELDDNQRVIRIFENAIKNKGEFKPELEKF